MLSGHDEDREELMMQKLGVFTGEEANYLQIITNRFLLFTQFVITLLYKSFQHKYP